MAPKRLRQVNTSRTKGARIAPSFYNDEELELYNEVFNERPSNNPHIKVQNQPLQQINNPLDLANYGIDKLSKSLYSGTANLVGGVAKTFANPGTFIDSVLDIPTSLTNVVTNKSEDYARKRMTDEEYYLHLKMSGYSDDEIADKMYNPDANLKVVNPFEKNIKGYRPMIDAIDNAEPLREPLNKFSKDAFNYANDISKSSYDEENLNGVTKFYGNTMAALGGMAPAIGAGVVTGNPAIALGTMAIGAYGNSLNEALSQDAELENAFRYGIANAATEIATEKLTGGISTFGGGLVDDITKEVIEKMSKNPTTKAVLKSAMDVLGEGFEEYVSEVVGEFTKDIYSNEKKGQSVTDRLIDVQDDALMAGLTGMASAGIINAPGYIKNAIANKNNQNNTNIPLKSNNAITNENSLKNPKIDTDDDVINRDNLKSTDALIAMESQKLNSQTIAVQAKKIGLNENVVKSIQAISNNVGVPVEFDVLPDNVNGMYRNGKIVLNQNTTEPIGTIFAHELTHSIEGTESYAKLEKAIYSHMALNNPDVESFVNEQINYYKELYAENGVDLSFDNAKSEVIAHYIQNNIADDNFIKSISNDTSLMHRIINWLNDFITNLTGTKEQKAYIELRNKYKQALNEIRVNTKVTQDGMKYSISKTFKENIRDIAKNKYIGSSYNALEVRNNTPDILKNLGLNDYPILMTLSHVKNALGIGTSKNQHLLDVSVLENIDKLMENPIAIYEKNGNLNALLRATDKNNNIIEIAIKPNGKGYYNNIEIDSNFLLTAFGKENIIRYYENIIDKTKILYPMNAQKNQLISEIIRYQSSNHSTIAGKYSISDDNENVNTQHRDSETDDVKYSFNHNKGYVGHSRSVRSSNAIENYEMPLNMFNKSVINEFVNQSDFDDQQKQILLNTPTNLWKFAAKLNGRSSWHHTGMYFNETDHYDLESTAEYILEKDNLKELYNEEKQNKIAEKQNYKYGVITVQEWGGTRSRPKLIGYDTKAGIVIGDWLYYKSGKNVLKYKTNANKVEKFKTYDSYNELVKNHKEYKNTKPIFNEIVKSQVTTKYSINDKPVDFKGIKLSPEQLNYFKDSKVVDESGKLQTYYNGSDNFNVYDTEKMSTESKWGQGIYLTPDKETATMYGKDIKESYVNIKNPIDLNRKTISFEEYNNLFKAINEGEESYKEDYDMYSNDMDLLWDLVDKGKWATYADLIQEHTGKDGLIINEDGTNKMVIAFNSNQIKRIDNLNPTTNPDIRYSIKDSTEETLSNILPKETINLNPKDSNNKISEELNELSEEYGKIKKGEHPSRDINVPKETPSGKTKQFYRTILESPQAGLDTINVLGEEIINGNASYKPISNKSLIDTSKNIENTIGYDGLYSDFISSNKINSQTIADGEYLLDKAMRENKTSDVVALSAKLADILNETGRSLQAARILKRLTPEGQIIALQKQVHRINKDINDKFHGKKPSVQVNAELVEKFGKAETEQERAKIMEEIQYDIAQQVPSTWSEKINQWRYLAMLGNPRTHIRNILGNTVFQPVVGTKNIIATTLENAAVKLKLMDKQSKSKAILNPLSKADNELIKFANLAFDEYKETFKATEKYGIEKEINQHKKIFKSKLLNKMSDLNSRALDLEDEIFTKFRFSQTLAEQMKAKGYDSSTSADLLQDLKDEAYNEALESVYRDTNALANGLNRLRRTNRATKIAMDALLPFTKTPMNIVKRTFEYSPVGLVKEITAGTVQLKKGKIDANTYINNLSKGLTGSGIAMLGFYLASLGLFRTKDQEPDKISYFKKDLGQQDYSIILPDGSSYTIDWLNPTVGPLAVGAELFNMAKAKYNKESTVSGILTAASTIFNPITDLSMIQGLTEALSSYNKNNKVSGIIEKAVYSYIGQFVPTLGAQIARVIDGTRRTTYSNDKIDKQLRIIKNKLPGIASTNEPYINLKGQKEINDDVLVRIFNNMLSPGYYKQNTADKYDKELLNLYYQTGKSEMIPGKYKSFTYEKEKVKLTPEEYTKINAYYSKELRQATKDFMDGVEYKDFDDNEKVAILSSIQQNVLEHTKAKLFGEDVLSKNKKIVDMIFDNQRAKLYQYYITKGIKNLKDENGKTIKNSKALLSRNNLEKLGVYDDIIEAYENGYITSDDLDIFNLSKTVINMDTEKYVTKYQELMDEVYAGTVTETEDKEEKVKTAITEERSKENAPKKETPKKSYSGGNYGKKPKKSAYKPMKTNNYKVQSRQTVRINNRKYLDDLRDKIVAIGKKVKLNKTKIV